MPTPNRFSQRMGYTPLSKKIQISSMDDSLRTGLWNCYWEIYSILRYRSSREWNYEDLNKLIWGKLLNKRMDEFDSPESEFKRIFLTESWYKVYDFIEFVSCVLQSSFSNEDFNLDVNKILEQEFSAYRLINNLIVPITNEVEIAGIEEAFEKTMKFSSLETANIHLSTSLSHFSRKPSPDFRNSIKESISAVESIAKIISKKPKGTLGEALKVIDQKIQIHKALQEGFGRIYGYTSDASGIRHSLMDEDNLTFSDAKYMLVSCSAFINYLIDKAAESQIDLN